MTSQNIENLKYLIGNTPLLAISFIFKGENRVIYAKSENLNFSGSIKDRMAFHILRKAYDRGAIKEGDRIVEATSGNTGIAFAAVGRALGHPVTIFMPDWMSQERKDLICSLGAELRLVSKKEGGFIGSIKLAEKMAENERNIFLPRQFSNEDNIGAHYSMTAPEMWWQLNISGLTPDAFVAGVGTGGTVMGVGRYFKEKSPKIKIYPLEPSNSPTMKQGGKFGSHRIQGISDEFIPPIVNLSELDEIIDVDDGDSIIMTQKLASCLGLGVGISSGANFIGALKIQEQLGKDSVVVTVFPDCNKKYLSTDLFKKEPLKENFYSPHVTLKNFSALKRACILCCDPSTCLEKEFRQHAPCDLPLCPAHKFSDII